MNNEVTFFIFTSRSLRDNTPFLDLLEHLLREFFGFLRIINRVGAHMTD
jgi:hypothetical protein